jgi:hypothetical protein
VVIGNQEWLIWTEIDKMLRRILEDPLSATGGGGGGGGWGLDGSVGIGK